jgi:prepilin-type N-terminal cleavage/methylation domain-containing protein
MSGWKEQLHMTKTLNLSAKPQHQTGFTLIEMAMVLMIVALLLGGLLPTISSQVEQRHMNDTRKQLDDIQQALIGYAVIHGYLPCPADGTIATGQPNAGIAKSTCNTGANGGVLPWVTLGVGETDAWGRRFTYRVTPAFATVSTPFKLSDTGNLNVGLTVGSSDVAANVPAVIVSHGKNGLGAYLPDGSQISPVPLATTPEGDNINNDNNFVSQDFVQNGFDDLVVWLSPNILFNRMVTAGKLP